MIRKKRGTKRTKSAPHVPGPKISPELIEPMALEVFGALGLALRRFGLNPARQKAIFERSQKAPTVKPASALHLNQVRPLGDLMTAWLEEMPYLNESGKPRVLELKGRGATFESLAKRFLPGRPLDQVVELAGRLANVGTLPGGRIALYGDTLVNLSKTPLSVLAETVLHVKQIVDTCLYNAERSEEEDPIGRTERIVSHVMNPEQFKKFKNLIGPQIHDLCERVDRLLKSGAKGKTRKGRRGAAAGIGVYVYYDGSLEHVRGGPGDDHE